MINRRVTLKRRISILSVLLATCKYVHIRDALSVNLYVD